MTVDCSKVNIKSGSTGETVKELQKYLQYLGYYKYNIDGKCGTETVNGIKSLQRKYNVSVDGVFGPKTCKASGINGEDISKTNGTIKLLKFKDMISRWNKYIETNKKEPNIMYVVYETPYEFVTKDKFKEMLQRYNDYVKTNGSEPAFMYINKNSSSNNSSSNNSSSSANKTTYIDNTLCEKQGGDCLGQITGYHCGPHSIKQSLRKFGITGYSESTIGRYAGTTSAGTGHYGLETAIAEIAKREGIKLKVEWKNFSDLGNTRAERFKALGKIQDDKNKTYFCHILYRDAYGHYEKIKSLYINDDTCIIPNSLGSKCRSPAYCGYMETRRGSTQARYFAGISQKSICIITKV